MLLSFLQYFPDRFVRKTLAKLSVKCSNTECQWIGNVEQLSQHLRECEFTKTQCKFCEEWLSASEVHFSFLFALLNFWLVFRLKPIRKYVWNQSLFAALLGWAVIMIKRYVIMSMIK